MKTKLAILPDAKLQQLLQQKNRAAFEEVFERYWKRLYSYAFKIYEDEKLCEDIVQEIFISLWEKSEQTPILKLEAYLFKAVKYKVAGHIRRLKFDEVRLAVVQEIPFPENFEKNIEYQELERNIHKEIKKLPPKCREVFIMSRFEHLSNQEIAKKLQLSVRTIEKHISNAIKHLKSNLNTIHFSVLVIGMFL